jgi:Zn-dependent M28 family amino/carboxypeptidase
VGTNGFFFPGFIMQLQFSKPGTMPLAPILDQGFLREIVANLSFPRVFGTPANTKAEAIVTEEFRKILGSSFLVGKARNVCFGNPEKARVLIGGHYDSVPGTPGADDNASAVAVMLAVAKAVGPRPDLIYVAFNGEECGLAGSKEFVNQLAGKMKMLEQVHVLEMVGYRDLRPNSQKNPLPIVQVPTTGDFLGIIGNRSGLVDLVIQQAGSIDVPVVGLTIPEGTPLDVIRGFSPHLLRSDHAPFWEKNIPAVMWTDTSEFRNPHYHQPTDTPNTLDYQFMAEVGSLLAKVVGF